MDTKLSKLEINSFSGDLKEQKSFNNSFETTFNQRTDVAKIGNINLFEFLFNWWSRKSNRRFTCNHRKLARGVASFKWKV